MIYVLAAAVALVLGLLLLYLGLTYAENYFFFAIFVVTLFLMGVCLYFTIKEIRLSSQKREEPTGETFLTPSDPTPLQPALPPASPPRKPGSPRPLSVTHHPVPPKTTAQAYPMSPGEFQRLLLSPDRDQRLVAILSRPGRYRYFALQKIAQMKLTHFRKKLRILFQSESRKPRPDAYFQSETLKTLWKLHPSFLQASDKKWLKKRGIVLK